MQNNMQSVITGNTFTTFPIKGTDTGITALYCRLSQDDGNVGDSDSIINQDEICQGVFLQKLQIVQENTYEEPRKTSGNHNKQEYSIYSRENG